MYAALASYGRNGYQEMLVRQISLSRAIARAILEDPAYILLPRAKVDVSVEQRLQDIYIIVLFRLKNEASNKDITKRLNASRRLYVSGTQWEGQPAARFAVANWQVDVERDIKVVKEVLKEAAS